jgi:hypothetical protein
MIPLLNLDTYLDLNHRLRIAPELEVYEAQGIEPDKRFAKSLARIAASGRYWSLMFEMRFRYALEHVDIYVAPYLPVLVSKEAITCEDVVTVQRVEEICGHPLRTPNERASELGLSAVEEVITLVGDVLRKVKQDLWEAELDSRGGGRGLGSPELRHSPYAFRYPYR